MFRKSCALDHTPIRAGVFSLVCCFAFAALFWLARLSFAQTADTSAIDAYLKAITQPPGSSRAAALERFAAGAPTSSLKLDALQWIVWEERRSHNHAAAATWAQKLLDADPDNPVALAIMVDGARQARQPASAYVDMAKRGAAGVTRLHRPEGMAHAEFTQMQQHVDAALNAALGNALLEVKDYAGARVPLAKAVAASPNDTQLVYSLAIADLSGEKPDRQQGYWLLARAVNLAGGAGAARQIEEFGRKKYKEDGGSDRDWDQYLVSTAAPGASAAVVLTQTDVAPGSIAQARRSDSRGTQAASAAQPRAGQTRANSTATQAPKTKPQKDKSRQKKEVATTSAPPRPSKSGWKGEREPPPESSAAANSLPPITGDAQARAPRSGPPVSLGILIETSVTRKQTRDAIVYSLSDLVRHLGLHDEAFILSFSNDLVFEEDLTGDSQRLQQAMDHIQPHPGTALLDAVGFASGHLQRIASNPNRVLLVISDGKNEHSRIPAPAASSEIRASGVKIYCIGVDVAESESMYRLQALANGTGGMAAFTTAPEQFRAAAQQVAGRIGIPFQF